MTLIGRNYLDAPPHLEKQTTNDDVNMMLRDTMERNLRDIKRELMKEHPHVLAVTKVQGGNAIIERNNQSVKLWFEIGGKPVTVYKILFYRNTVDAHLSIASMSKQSDGWDIDDVPTVLDICVDELYVFASSDSYGINIPDNQTTDGSIFVYGFTIPDSEKEDY